MMQIADRKIGPDQRPYIIAEMSGNHNASLDRALEIVDAAGKTGADALKLQTYTADTMTFDKDDGEFRISDPKSPWVGQTMHQLYQKAHTPWEWHKPIMERAAHHGMACFSSPFDESAVDFLETLDVPAYKIASFECVDLPLIRRVAQTGKPMIISTGMAQINEIEAAVATARDAGCNDIVLLKCTSTYPSLPENSNLHTIPSLQQIFGCQVGLSDHTMGIGVAAASVALGACVIEKHLTLDRNDGGVDSQFSLEPSEFSSLVIETERAWQALGHVFYGPTEAERVAVTRRRSLYFGQDMKTGDVLTPENLRRTRPGLGLPPKYYDELLGRRVSQDVKSGTPVTWDALFAQDK